MKTETICILITLVAAHSPIVLAAAPRGNSPAEAVSANQSIPWDAIGAAPARQCPGAALAVPATDDGAPLHCAFQKIDGHATEGGLWLTSTTANSAGERFCLAATTLRRTRGGVGDDTRVSSVHAKFSGFPAAGVGERSEISLASTGKVRVVDAVVRWERSGLTEEYSVSTDGVRQDFIIERRPPGEGHLRLELELSGAQAEAAAYGAKLILNGSRRELAYSRLRATDTTGKELSAKLEVLSASLLAVRVDDQGAAYPVRVDPTFSDANWVSLGGLPGADETVFAMITDTNAGRLYVGGSFAAIGTAVAAGVAAWNGTNWSGLGAGLGGTVRALALDGAGNLYAAGYFTNAVLMATNLARWDGTNWTGLGWAMNGEILAVAVDGSGTVYAGGLFTNASVMVTNVAQRQGGAWSPMGLGMNSTVFALALDGLGNLYAGGNFTNADGGSANRVALWNGSGWSPVGQGMNSRVDALLPDQFGHIYAGGSFTTADGFTANRVAFWDGSQWSAVGAGVGSTVLALALDSAGNLYASGLFSTAGGSPASRVAVWNGSSWSALGSGLSSFAYAVGLDTAGKRGNRGVEYVAY